MYPTFLSIHSIVRWLVIVAGVAAVVTAVRAARGGRVNQVPALVFTVAFDVQLLIGALLYLRLSPITTTAIHQFDRAMGNEILRFWAVEHPVGMVIALGLTHLARMKMAKAPGNPPAARRAAVYFVVALLVALLAMPWPFQPYGRPLL